MSRIVTEHVPKPWMTVDEVAEWLSVHRNTIYKLVRRGELVAVRVGQQFRISRESLGKYLEAAHK